MNKLLRIVKGSHSFIRLVQDMNRTDEVFQVIQKLDNPELMLPVVAHFKTSERGRAAFAEQPRVGKIDLQQLKTLPEGTLGRAYAEHMLALGLDPAFFPQLPVTDDLSYMRMHLFETHDIWHVVTGFATNVAGELGLQSFYAAQFPQGPLPPVLLAAGMLNTVLHQREDNASRFDAVARGWFLGRAAAPLFGVHWGELWAEPLATVRQNLNVQAPDALKVLAS